MASKHMTSNEDKDLSTAGAPGDIAPDVPAGNPAPAKKAAAKRAPRKATKKASTPKKASARVTATAEVTATTDATPPTEVTVPADVAAPRTRKIAKRAPRKSAKKSTAPPVVLDPGQAAPAHIELDRSALAQIELEQDDQAPVEPTRVDQSSEPEAPAAVADQSFGLFFQPPAPTAAPRRRRATAPAAAPEQSPTRRTSAAATGEQTDDGRQDNVSAAKTAEESEDSKDSDADGAPRRRRRGGKGRRGRSGGDGDADESTTATTTQTGTPADASGGGNASIGGSSEATQSGQPSSDDDESAETGESHRRTRRRRRGSAGEGDDQQQQPSSGSGGTTTRVREPRPKRDEVSSVKGSTRLEAKKQRRREGREAGRRRTVITEAEFLARRESVERVMVVRNKQDRTQIGVLEDGVLVEHYVSDESNASMAGNVYLGRIQNVLPSMEAAFVDIGKGRNAVLYAGEVNWDAAGLDNRARRIENALSSGQSVLVQVTKDPIGHKGARLTSQVSLPGRYLVYVPDGNMMGISRKLPDTERARLKKILREVVPENAGVIVRTAAEGASEDELRADVTRLTAVWEDIQAKSKSKNANAPALLHGESDLTVRVIRDVFNEDFAKLVVAGDPAWQTVNGYLSTVAPDLADRVQRWTGEQDLFTHYRVDEQISKAMDRKVWLPSGGTLVIDRTEAMTVVDVNTGKFVGSGGNLEETVTKNNVEAAEEVVRQLRLRDIGGIIVIDFIDMVLESNRDLVVRRLLECLGRDRTKHQVAEVTSLGLVQMTRKRVGAGLIEVFSETCEHCNGRGIIVSADPIDRPAGDNGGGNGGRGNSAGGNSGANSGTSGGANSGGSKGSGGKGDGNDEDGGSGRSGRGRRSRGSSRDTNVSVGPAPELKGTTSGPTPAQIAAAAHAAAVQAMSPAQASPGGTSLVETSPVETPPVETSPVETSPVETPPADQPLGVPVEAVAPVRSRRRSSRSAKSPAFSVPPTAEPLPEPRVVVESALEQQSVRPSTPAAEVAPDVTATPAAHVAPDPDVPADAGRATSNAPAARSRRKRPRVVAPAGPPPGADHSEADGGEFGS